MYFIQQLFIQFSANIYNSFEGPGTPGWNPEAAKQRAEKKEEKDKDPKIALEGFAGSTAELRKKMGNKAEVMRAQQERLHGIGAKSRVEGGVSDSKELASSKVEIQALTPQEALARVKPTPEETQLALGLLGTDASPEAIQESIFMTRRDALSTSEIKVGDKDVIESLYIDTVAKESGVDPELMKDMRALGFQGLDGKTPEESAEALKNFALNMENLQTRITQDGGEMPTTKEEFIALYEAYQLTNGDIHIPLSADDATNMGVKTDPKTGGIDPSTPGYRQVGDMVVSQDPNQPYSRGGQIYSPNRGSSYEGGGTAMNLDNLPPGVPGLSALIVQAEASGNYDIIYSGCSIKPPKPITQMTLREVSDFQDQMVASGSDSTACGGIQIIRGTLDPYVKKYPDQIFDQAFQEKLITAKFEERGLSKFRSGAINEGEFIKRLSMEWASLPKDASGVSYYAGTGNNHARVEYNDLLQVVQGIKNTPASTESTV